MYWNPSSLVDCNLSNQDRIHAIKNWFQQLQQVGGPDYKQAFEYFSIWTLLLFPIPFQTRLFQLLKYNMILQTCLGGFYITYIHPKIIHVHYLQLDIDKLLLKFIDFCAHHSLLLLYFIIFNDNVFPPKSFCEYYIINCPFVFYCLSYSIYHKYGLTFFDMFVLFIVYHLIIFLFFFL